MTRIICDLCGEEILNDSAWISFTAQHKGHVVHFGAGMKMMPSQFHAHNECWFKLWPKEPYILTSLIKDRP